jgi:hypothetical protein
MEPKVFNEKYHVEFAAIPPYSFALSVHKPAGWWWSTPTEVFEGDTLWTTARLDKQLYGFRLEAAGTSRKPAVVCAVFSDKAMGDAEKDYVSHTVERALSVKRTYADSTPSPVEMRYRGKPLRTCMG